MLKLVEKSTGGEIHGGQIDDRVNDHINLIFRGEKKVIFNKVNLQAVPSLYYM